MSAIDAYKHKLLGSIECPSTNPLVLNNPFRRIGIYQLLENIPDDESSFDGNTGDILIGGGQGEAPALRISNPLAFQFFSGDRTSATESKLNHPDQLFKTFWTPTQSYIIGEGFAKLGWTPDIQLDYWLVEMVCKLLISELPEFDRYRSNQTSETGGLTLRTE